MIEPSQQNYRVAAGRRLAGAGAVVIALLLAWAVPGVAGPHEDGDKAVAQGDYAAAAKAYMLGAAQGNHWSENSLGTLFEKGLGTPADAAAAAKWYAKAAAAGNPWGQYNLGRCYDTGIGVAADPAMAADLFAKAAAQGNDWAAYRLGQLYASGTGVTKDKDKSRSYFDAAARAGNNWAQYELAELYAAQGGRKPLEAALLWYRKSADQNNPWASYKLALLLLDGIVTDRDTEEGARLLRLSASLGNPLAVKELKRRRISR